MLELDRERYPDTYEKLNEANYFLGWMAATEGTDKFPYEVSAFLAAARSVKDILKREASAILRQTGTTADDRKELMDEIELAMTGDAEMKKLRDARDSNLHEGMRLLQAAMEEVGLWPFSDDPGINDWLLRRRRRQPRSSQHLRSRMFQPGIPPARIYEPRWFFTDIEDRDAWTVCAQHLAKITQVAQRVAQGLSGE